MGFRRSPSQAMAELGFKARAELFDTGFQPLYWGFFICISTNYYIKKDGDVGPAGCWLKRQIPKAHPAVTSLNL